MQILNRINLAQQTTLISNIIILSVKINKFQKTKSNQKKPRKLIRNKPNKQLKNQKRAKTQKQNKILIIKL
jgi:hypothetical protein